MDPNLNVLSIASSKRLWLEKKTVEERMVDVNLRYLFLKQGDIRKMQGLLLSFQKQMTIANIPWVPAWGSLLGIKRQYPSLPMPWDDDIDIYVRLSDRDNVIAAFTNQKFTMTFSVEDNRIFIEGQKKKMVKGVLKTSWPFIEIFFTSSEQEESLLANIDTVQVPNSRGEASSTGPSDGHLCAIMSYSKIMAEEDFMSNLYKNLMNLTIEVLDHVWLALRLHEIK